MAGAFFYSFLGADNGFFSLRKSRWKTWDPESRELQLKLAGHQTDDALARGEISQSKYDDQQREIVETGEKLMSVTAALGGLGAVVTVVGWVPIAAVITIIVGLWNKCDWYWEAVIAVWEAVKSDTIVG